MSEVLEEIIHEVTEMAAVDIIFKEEDKLKVYHHATAEAVEYNSHGIISSSVLGQFLLDVRQGESMSVCPLLHKDPAYNRDVDMPVN